MALAKTTHCTENRLTLWWPLPKGLLRKFIRVQYNEVINYILVINLLIINFKGTVLTRTLMQIIQNYQLQLYYNDIRQAQHFMEFQKIT